MVTIAHAVCDERGRTSGGSAGNQTANLYHTTGELRFSEWYNPNGGWDYVIRPKKKEKAQAIAAAAMSAVRNAKIGYDQSDRESLYDQIQYVGFDPTKVIKPCNCDCSSLVTVCCNYAGIPILRGTYTGNLKERCEAVGFFKIYKGAKYVRCSNNLKVGDILLRVGHHAAVVVNCMYHMTRNLKIGSSGTDVIYLQATLNLYLNEGLKRYAAIKEDGEFGIKTQYLLTEYQRIFKLETDGIMGPITAAHMGFLWR